MDNSLIYTVIEKDFENSVIVEGVVEPTYFTTVMCPVNVDGTIIFMVEDGTQVNAGDVICIIEDNNNETNYNNLLDLIESISAELSTKKADLQMQQALLEAQVRNNEADTEIANLDSLQFRFASPTQRQISELQLESASIEKSRLEKRLQTLKIINDSEIKSIEINLRRAQSRLETAKEILESLTVRAPTSGLAIVSQSRRSGEKLKIGDEVWNNMPLVIIPEMSEMKVQMRLSETDFKYISENDSVSYSFNAMPDNWANGKITKMLPVGQPYSRDSKLKYFEVEASVDSILEMPEPGFTANCRVIVDYIKDTITVPQVAIFDEDSRKVVYVKKNKTFERREIKTGLSSQKESVVIEGLNRDEKVALTKPNSSLIKSERLLINTTSKQ
jgi:multidrug efflux pump subunit AcrA (membrane-fusion protein)